MTDRTADTSDNHGEIEALLLACFEHDESEWDGVIDALCREHPDKSDVLRLRYGVLRDVGFLGAIALPGPGRAETADAQPVRIGDFRLLRKLGRGGMGIVYLARQESVGRDVALKVLHTGLGLDAKARERFQLEVEAAARVDHPGICTVFEAGTADGTPYVAMRYIDGVAGLGDCGDGPRTVRGEKLEHGPHGHRDGVVFVQRVTDLHRSMKHRRRGSSGRGVCDDLTGRGQRDRSTRIVRAPVGEVTQRPDCRARTQVEPPPLRANGS